MASNLPLDIVGCITDELSGDINTLQSLALTCHGCLFFCQKHIFRHVNLSSQGNIPERHLRLHYALTQHPHLGRFVKTLSICLPGYTGEVSYTTKSTLLPITLHQLTQLQTLHIIYLPEMNGAWWELEKALIHLFSLPSLRNVIVDNIFHFPIRYLDHFKYVENITFLRTNFAPGSYDQHPNHSSLPPSTSSLESEPTPKQKTKTKTGTYLRSLRFQHCHSDTLITLFDYVKSSNSKLSMEKLVGFTLFPWTVYSARIALEVLRNSGSHESLRDVTWAYKTVLSLTNDNIDLSEFPSLETLTLFGELESDSEPIQSLVEFISKIPSSSSNTRQLLQSVHIRLIVPAVPPFAHLLSYDWQSLDKELVDLLKRKGAKRYSIEFMCPCLPHYGFHHDAVDSLSVMKKRLGKVKPQCYEYEYDDDESGCGNGSMVRSDSRDSDSIIVTHQRFVNCDQDCCNK